MTGPPALLLHMDKPAGTIRTQNMLEGQRTLCVLPENISLPQTDSAACKADSPCILPYTLPG